MSKAKRIVGEVALYGTSQIGAGWIAPTAAGVWIRDGEPKLGRSFTEAIFQACAAIAKSESSGVVRIYSPDGQRVAETPVSLPRYFGDLSWQPAQQYVLALADLVEVGK